MFDALLMIGEVFLIWAGLFVLSTFSVIKIMRQSFQ
jgi:hypothetical protein